jgi:aminoglycoside 2''-phosphotransferase
VDDPSRRAPLEAARARLIRELSPLAAETVEVLGAGAESETFRVDGSWVVRFPLDPDAQRSAATELVLLPALAPHLPVPVPRPEHVGERDGRIVFVAYRALEGEPLDDAALTKLPAPARARALDELAALLDAIHRFPVERAQAAGVGLELLKGGYHAEQAALEQQLAELLAPAEREGIAAERRAFEAAQGRARRAAPPPVLLHSDVKPDHLLHDPSTGALTGLLDWGDVSLGHADFDLAIVGAFCGPRTLQGLLDRMDPADAERARASIPFLLTIRGLQDAVYDAARGQDPKRALKDRFLGTPAR